MGTNWDSCVILNPYFLDWMLLAKSPGVIILGDSMKAKPENIQIKCGLSVQLTT